MVNVEPLFFILLLIGWKMFKKLSDLLVVRGAVAGLLTGAVVAGGYGIGVLMWLGSSIFLTNVGSGKGGEALIGVMALAVCGIPFSIILGVIPGALVGLVGGTVIGLGQMPFGGRLGGVPAGAIGLGVGILLVLAAHLLIPLSFSLSYSSQNPYLLWLGLPSLLTLPAMSFVGWLVGYKQSPL